MSKTKGNVVGPDEASRATAPTRCRLYILYMGPAEQDKEWTDDGSRARRASSAGSGASCSRSPRGRRRGRPADGELAREAHATIDRVTDDILRRFQFHTPIAALFELVNELSRGHRRGREVALRDRDRPLADPAVRAARRRGAVGAARPRAALGAAVAGGRPGAPRARDGRGRRPGERQAPRPAEVPAGHAGGRARRAGARVRARAGARERRARDGRSSCPTGSSTSSPSAAGRSAALAARRHTFGTKSAHTRDGSPASLEA